MKLHEVKVKIIDDGDLLEGVSAKAIQVLFNSYGWIEMGSIQKSHLQFYYPNGDYLPPSYSFHRTKAVPAYIVKSVVALIAEVANVSELVVLGKLIPERFEDTREPNENDS